MEFVTYVRKPFEVDVVEITEENMQECAKYIGDVREEDGKTFILVDRRLVPNISRVYVGYFMTRMGRNTRVYSRKLFREQFMPINDSLKEWLAYIEESAE